MLNTWTEDGGKGPYYCPDCGVVEGFFTYSPDVRKELEIISVDFQKPRQKVINALGDENQSCPVLVLDDGTKIPEGAKKSLTTGKSFIDDARLICDFLAETFNAVKPH